MDKQYLNDEFNRFFEFTTEDKSQVSSVSAKLFAEHIAYPLERELETLRQRVQELEQQLTEVRRAERERCAKACEAFSEDDDAMDRQVKAQCAKLILAME